MLKYFIIICTIVACAKDMVLANPETSERPDKSSYPVNGGTKLETETIERSYQFRSVPREIFNPCENPNALLMQRTLNQSINEENYWDGFIDMEKFGSLRGSVGYVKLRLKAPANVTVEKEVGSVWHDVNENAFHIVLRHGTVRRFHVQGQPRGVFPQLDELHLNDRNICPNPMPWTSSYVGDRIDTNSESKCGRRIVQHQKLITNAFLTQEGQWPWHAAILRINIRSNTSIYNNGGTLISSKFVLTAGHCVIELSSKVMSPERILVRLGQHNRLLVDANTQEFRLSDIILHENFSSYNSGNDIALLKLASDVQYTDYIQPACLWERTTVDLSSVVGKLGYIIGWGDNEEHTLSDVLMQARIPVVSYHTCLDSNRRLYSNYLSRTNFCAGYRNGTGACNGDSGGGMFFQTNKSNSYWLRGIVSLSLAVEREGKSRCGSQYVLFTDVAQYLDWIESHLNEGKQNSLVAGRRGVGGGS